MKVKLISHTPNPMEAVSSAMSNCYDSKAGVAAFRHCMRSGHHSVFEFINFQFKITGVSRAFMAQLTRHRIASYAIRSQRYVREENFDYIVPPSVRSNSDLYEYYTRTMEKIRKEYVNMIAKGIPAEDARYILPNATETVIEFGINYRSLLNMSGIRLCTRTQWEFRKVMKLIVEEVEKVEPELAKYLTPKCVQAGGCNEDKNCGYYSSITKE